MIITSVDKVINKGQRYQLCREVKQDQFSEKKKFDDQEIIRKLLSTKKDKKYTEYSKISKKGSYILRSSQEIYSCEIH